MTIIEGEKAPYFTLNNQHGAAVSLSQYGGKWVVVYFYPKDDTPGCTKEACTFRNLQQDFDAANAVILGISPDDADSHRAFIEKFQLPFQLLSDPDKIVMQPWGAWGEKNLYGRVSVGVIRSTVLINPEGIVSKHWKRVAKAASHPEYVLKAIA